MVIRELIKLTAARLREGGNDNPVFEAHCLVRHVTGMSATALVLNHNKEAEASRCAELDGYIARRVSGEPLQYILGTQEFMSLEFKVTPDVLIPRADTETLVEYVLDKVKNKSATLIDIGTGTGCIPLSIAYYNKNAFVRGVDISEKALTVARENASRLGLGTRAVFEYCDIMTECPKGKYDVITSNPPYIKSDVIETLQTEVRDFEPRGALDGGADGLDFYRRITAAAPTLLKEGGTLVFEIGYDQGKAVSDLMSADFENVGIIKDLCGNDRVVTGELKNARD